MNSQTRLINLSVGLHGTLQDVTANGSGPSPDGSGRSSALTRMPSESSTECVVVKAASSASWKRWRITPIVKVKFVPWLCLARVTLTTERNGPRNLSCSSFTCTNDSGNTKTPTQCKAHLPSQAGEIPVHDSTCIHVSMLTVRFSVGCPSIARMTSPGWTL